MALTRSLFLSLLCLLIPSALYAQTFTKFDSGLMEVSKKIVNHINSDPNLKRLQKEIVIGDFTSTIARHRASGGPAIAHGLTRALQTQGFTVSEDGPFQLTGKFILLDEPASTEDSFNSSVLAISVTLGDDMGKELQIFSTRITEATAPLIISGATASFPLLTSLENQQQISIHAVQHPSARIEEQKTRSDEQSPFALEVLRRKSDGTLESLNAIAEAGRSTVLVAKDDTLVFRLHNEAAFECAVRLTIDGIDWDGFAADKNWVAGSMHIVKPREFLDVTSWYVSANDTPTFKVTAFPQGAAALKGQTSSIRTISAVFHACWEEDKQRPEDEFKTRSIDGNSESIGFGKSDGKSFKQVQRTVGRFRSIVSVRYRTEN
jgi:hypothetical protein